MLVYQVFVIGRPLRFNVRSHTRGHVSDNRVSGIIVDVCDPDAPVSGMLGFVRVECDPLAVMRPCRPPRFEMSLCNLDCTTALRRNHVKMIPTIKVSKKCNPFPVWRRLRPGISFPIRQTPELFFFVLVDCSRTGRDVGYINCSGLVVV